MSDACRGKKLQKLFLVAIFAAELHTVYGDETLNNEEAHTRQHSKMLAEYINSVK